MQSFGSRRTRLTSLAQKDYLSATRWYKKNTSDLVAERFMLEVEQTLELMRRSPEAFRLVFRDRRKALLKVFPFQIIFIRLDDVLVVLSIMHTSRDPSHWQDRLLPGEATHYS